MSALLDALSAPAPLVLAPTGMVPTRESTPHVPLTPAEVADDVAACWELGITSVHLHARDKDGHPTWHRDVYARLVGAVRERVPEVLINVSTSGRTWSELERRADVLALDGDLAPDIASLTPSSLNFLTAASVNAPDVVRGLAGIMRDRGIVPEFEVFDLGMISMMRRLVAEGLAREPLLVNLFFGNLAGLQPTALEVGLAAERLPAGTVWSGAGLGDYQGAAHLLSIATGGGVRTGLEDALHPHGTREELATNAGLVEQAHLMLSAAGRAVMTPAELRERLEP
ncbi:MAG: 3-keto-5-aminohexanoate cleavage protein [Schumannella sp.]|nr:3-keto-5-aminohexanoate cleavage protein [Microbacteriaceae bacterium]